MVHDIVVVGGGPAGSTCARFLARAGARVAVVDRAPFPRVKLCAGWLSTQIWDELALASREYSGGLWPWTRCHVRYAGADRTIRCRGWFIRRFEFDDFLLRRAGATLSLGVPVREITRADGLWSVAGLRARILVGAGGTYCPVARLLAPPRPGGPVGVQENEFRADRAAVARTRIGRDGEPELLLHDDLSGYSWNVPKGDWLNVGTGTADPNRVRAAWKQAGAHFQAAGHLPAEAARDLESMKGHAYYLYDPAHLAAAARVDPDGKGGAFLCGDSLGLAQPLTAEGILPAVISGRLCAEAIASGRPADYPKRLAAHEVIADYGRLARVREIAAARRAGKRRQTTGGVSSLRVSSLRRWAVSSGFAWMFSGAALPAPRLVDFALARAARWRGVQPVVASGRQA